MKSSKREELRSFGVWRIPRFFQLRARRESIKRKYVFFDLLFLFPALFPFGRDYRASFFVNIFTLISRSGFSRIKLQIRERPEKTRGLFESLPISSVSYIWPPEQGMHHHHQNDSGFRSRTGFKDTLRTMSTIKNSKRGQRRR